MVSLLLFVVVLLGHRVECCGGSIKSDFPCGRHTLLFVGSAAISWACENKEGTPHCTSSAWHETIVRI